MNYTKLFWRVGGSLVAMFLLGTGLLQLLGLLAYNTQQIDERIEIAERVGPEALSAVQVSVESGTVEIVGVRSSAITVTGKVTSGLLDTTHRESAQGDRYVIEASCPDGPASNHCDATYRIEVPDDLEVVVTSDNTDVTVRDLRGRVDVRTSNSPIRAENLTGTVSLETSNDVIDATALGSMITMLRTSNDRVRAEFVEAPRTVDIVSSNDNVAVVVPDTSASYAVDVRTSNGGQFIDIRTDPTSERSIRAHTSNADVEISYPRS